jgi:hypothetical protein
MIDLPGIKYGNKVMSTPEHSSTREAQICILLFKSKTRWADHLIRKLSLEFSVFPIYALPQIREYGFGTLLKNLNQEIVRRGASCVFFSVDFFPSIDVRFIQGVDPSVKKVFVTFDDCILHPFNSISAARCDLVLTADPISVLKYQEKGIPAEYCPLESSAEIYKPAEVKKKQGVLFFGARTKSNRPKYFEYFKERGIAVKVVGVDSRFLNLDDLVQEINSAKIVLNFSQTDCLDANVSDVFHAYDKLFQFKGRIIEAGLCRTACISEYSPAIPLLFGKGEVPIFRNPEECVQMIEELLSDDDQLEVVASRLYDTVTQQFEDSVIMTNVMRVLRRLSTERKDTRIVIIPSQYNKIALRGRLRQISAKPSEVIKELRDWYLSNDGTTHSARLVMLGGALTWFVYFLTKERIQKWTSAPE